MSRDPFSGPGGDAAAREVVEALLRTGTARAERLTGGLLNHVFRVHLERGGTVVVKHAPPHLASRPEIPLSQDRARVEAEALSWLARGGPWGVRTPQLFARRGSTLVLEDLGPGRHLDAWLAEGGSPAVLDQLGRFVRELHDAAEPPELHNRVIQETRLAVQYEAVPGILAQAGVRDASLLGGRVLELGRRLLERGPAFVMGDLWPPSVMVQDGGRLSVLDWELATLGRPCQDTGHLVAHLWLGSVRLRHAAGLEGRFLGAYGALSPDHRRDSATHFAAELLVRTRGPFQPDPPDSAPVLAASLAAALAALRDDWLPGA